VFENNARTILAQKRGNNIKTIPAAGLKFNGQVMHRLELLCIKDVLLLKGLWILLAL